MDLASLFHFAYKTSRRADRLSVGERELALLYWTAYIRPSSNLASPNEQTTCPMSSCKEQHSTLALLLLHLAQCPSFSSGHYWCSKCAQEETINLIEDRRLSNHGGILHGTGSKVRRAAEFFRHLGSKGPTRSGDSGRASPLSIKTLHFHTGSFDGTPVDETWSPSNEGSSSKSGEIDSPRGKDVFANKYSKVDLAQELYADIPPSNSLFRILSSDALGSQEQTSELSASRSRFYPDAALSELPGIFPTRIELSAQRGSLPCAGERPYTGLPEMADSETMQIQPHIEQYIDIAFEGDLSSPTGVPFGCRPSMNLPGPMIISSDVCDSLTAQSYWGPSPPSSPLNRDHAYQVEGEPLFGIRASPVETLPQPQPTPHDASFGDAVASRLMVKDICEISFTLHAVWTRQLAYSNFRTDNIALRPEREFLTLGLRSFRRVIMGEFVPEVESTLSLIYLAMVCLDRRTENRNMHAWSELRKDAMQYQQALKDYSSQTRFVEMVELLLGPEDGFPLPFIIPLSGVWPAMSWSLTSKAPVSASVDFEWDPLLKGQIDHTGNGTFIGGIPYGRIILPICVTYVQENPA